jgi:hypothetical protein
VREDGSTMVAVTATVGETAVLGRATARVRLPDAG